MPHTRYATLHRTHASIQGDLTSETELAASLKSPELYSDHTLSKAGLVSSALLVGCGGGKKASAPTAAGQSPSVPISQGAIVAEKTEESKALPLGEPVDAAGLPIRMPERSAVRFLAQASFGARLAEIESVRDKWRTGWLADQFVTAPTISHWDNCLRYQAEIGKIEGSWDQQVWEMYATSPDQLRKRVGYALSQIMVVSVAGLIGGGGDRSLCMAAYMDWLEKGAFGNFRDLLQDVTVSPAMGYYLSSLNSARAVYDSQGNAIKKPDENYAREVMQLFTIGTVELNIDGSVKLVNGVPKETYSISDVENLARVFTGWTVQNVTAGIARWNKPMLHYATRHSQEKKVFLGVKIDENTDGPTSLRTALDTLFNHPNVGPFIGKQLIQKLVTSNPSPAYVERVARRFNDDGTGKRGDMKAVITQVLTDPEAMSPIAITNPATNWGKLREPVLRYLQLIRILNAQPTTANAVWGLTATTDPSSSLGQSPGRAPSVFNFFEPTYAPPGSAIANANLRAPEFQLLNEVSVVGILNFFYNQLNTPPRNVRFDFSPFLDFAAVPETLVEKLCMYIANAAISQETRGLMVQTLRELPSPVGNSANALLRVKMCLLMILASPEYLIQK